MEREKYFKNLLLAWALVIVQWLFIFFYSQYKQWSTETIVDNNTWYNDTWINNTISEYTKTILSWFNNNNLVAYISDYPKIKINSKISQIQLIAEIEFTNNFKEKYKYEDSSSYFFWLNFFLWDFDNGGYYGVYRKQNWWIGNSTKNKLFWAKLANEIKDWTTRYIPLTKDIPIAVDAEKRTSNIQFTYFNAEDYLNNNIGKEIPIWVYLSSTSEVKWWNLTYIKSLKIVYVWEKNAIEVIK